MTQSSLFFTHSPVAYDSGDSNVVKKNVKPWNIVSWVLCTISLDWIATYYSGPKLSVLITRTQSLYKFIIFLISQKLQDPWIAEITRLKTWEYHGFPDVPTSNSLVFPTKLTLAHNYFVTFFSVVYSLHSFVNLTRNRTGHDDVLS